MNKISIILLSALLITGCDQAPVSQLAGARLGGDFTLINQDGRATTQANFAGQYRIMYTGYTNCPDICPTDALVIGQAVRGFEELDKDRGSRVTPIFLSADPERDTPERLKAFLANFHPRFVGLTGPVKTIDETLKRYGSYGLRNKKTGIVDHSRAVILYGPDGKPIAPLPVETDSKKVVEQLDYWVR